MQPHYSALVPGAKARTASAWSALRHAQGGPVDISGAIPCMQWWVQKVLEAPAASQCHSPIFLTPAPVHLVTVHSDASAKYGVAAYTLGARPRDDKLLHRALQPSERGRSSLYVELLPVCVAVDELSRDWPPNSVVILAVDNAGVCNAVNSGRVTARDSIELIHELFDLAHDKQLHILACHTQRDSNKLADAMASCMDTIDAVREWHNPRWAAYKR